ncbi:MAG: hypothetical protein FD149_35 [Rhodospirillaceae bacterium]|nr:MAG: hypothetical protein FD149_35 [Rhodospirillaceae bacterium]
MTMFFGRLAAQVFPTVVLAGGILAANHLYAASFSFSFRDVRFLSGWELVGIVGWLALFGMQRRLVTLSTLKASVQQRVHIATGWGAVGVFVLHTDGRLPQGRFDWWLWSLFVAVAVSGVIGAAFYTFLPARLHERPHIRLWQISRADIEAGGDRRRNNEMIFMERIPFFRAKLGRLVEQEVMAFTRDTGSMVILDFYVHRLAPFFRGPRHMLFHLFQSHHPVHRISLEMRPLERYLDEAGRESLGKIEKLIRFKDHLDYLHAHHMMLKGWLFIHVPLTAALLIVSAAHGILVHAFTAGSP